MKQSGESARMALIAAMARQRYKTKNRERRLTIKWTHEQTHALIRQVERREALWNRELPAYKDRQTREWMWNEVAKYMKMTRNEVVNKWNSLRNVFRMTHTRTNKRVSTNEFYKGLLFLAPTLRAEVPKTSSELELMENCEATSTGSTEEAEADVLCMSDMSSSSFAAKLRYTEPSEEGDFGIEEESNKSNFYEMNDYDSTFETEKESAAGQSQEALDQKSSIVEANVAAVNSGTGKSTQGNLHPVLRRKRRFNESQSDGICTGGPIGIDSGKLPSSQTSPNAETTDVSKTKVPTPSEFTRDLRNVGGNEDNKMRLEKAESENACGDFLIQDPADGYIDINGACKIEMEDEITGWMNGALSPHRQASPNIELNRDNDSLAGMQKSSAFVARWSAPQKPRSRQVNGVGQVFREQPLVWLNRSLANPRRSCISEQNKLTRDKFGEESARRNEETLRKRQYNLYQRDEQDKVNRYVEAYKRPRMDNWDNIGSFIAMNGRRWAATNTTLESRFRSSLYKLISDIEQDAASTSNDCG